MPPHLTPLHRAAAEAAGSLAGVDPAELKVDTPRAELGDFAIPCFAIAKAAGKNPAELARSMAERFTANQWLATATAQGPFVNFRADRAHTFRWLIESCLSGTLLPKELGTGKTICIDYSSPNISKHLAYHHIRGTVIGHALVHIYRALGYQVIGINFLGDWGTTHGNLLAAWSKWGAGVEGELDVTKLNELYVRFNAAMKDNPAVEAEGRAWFKRLEDGDPDARVLWQKFRDVSWAEFAQVYDILGIEFEEVRGESAYEPDLPGVMQELTDKGLVSTSEGAQVVQIPGEKTPLLLRKQDGSTLYATRDIAAAEYRHDTFHFARSLYVVGREQALHFRQLFKALALAGHTWAGTWDGDKYTPGSCQHVPYGHIRIGGKKTATRLGNVVLMRQVFDIMQDEMRELIAKNNPTRTPEEIDPVARTVGIGAVVFGNLAAQREKDVDFDMEKVTSTQGDSGPYLQYVHARCASIERKAETPLAKLEDIDLSLLTHDAEWAVARRLLELPDVVTRAGDSAEPHLVCHYLLQLASEFSYWYTLGNGDKSLRVLCEDPKLQQARRALAAAVRAAMASGLGLLGIGAPEWM